MKAEAGGRDEVDFWMAEGEGDVSLSVLSGEAYWGLRRTEEGVGVDSWVGIGGDGKEQGVQSVLGRRYRRESDYSWQNIAKPGYTQIMLAKSMNHVQCYHTPKCDYEFHKRNKKWQNDAKPMTVDYLVILEAPPVNERHMYDPRRNSGILTVILYAFNQEYEEKGRMKKRDVLNGLKKERIFVIDACLCPMKKDDKEDFIMICAKNYLAKELEEIEPQKKVLIAKMDLPDGITRIVRESGYAGILCEKRFPFPGYGQQGRFMSAIRELNEVGEI